MKVAVFGDIHGHVETVEAALKVNAKRKIFVGDFLDSFTRSPEDQIECLRLVMDAQDAEAILGNHEASYLYDQRCSGYNRGTANYINAMGRTKIANWLKDYVWLEFDSCRPICISHAGVSAAWFDRVDDRSIITDEVLDWLDNHPVQERYAAGRFRGGWLPIGGHLWCDWWKEFEPIPAVRQIVGHSYYRPRDANPGVVTIGDNYNIDCLGRTGQYVLIDDDGVISIEELDI